MTEQLDAMLELRKKYRGYMPWALAKVPGELMLYEFVSWPWTEANQVWIIARPIDDSTRARHFIARKQIHPVRWSVYREKAYVKGFRDGVKYAVQEARKYREAAK